MWDQAESRFLSWLVAFASISLLLARRSSDVTDWTSLPLCFWRTRFWYLNSSLSWSMVLFQWVKDPSSSLCLSSCVFYSWYCTKKLSSHWISCGFEYLISQYFLSYFHSVPRRVSVWSLRLFLSWSLILSRWVKSACISLYAFPAESLYSSYGLQRLPWSPW